MNLNELFLRTLTLDCFPIKFVIYFVFAFKFTRCEVKNICWIRGLQYFIVKGIFCVLQECFNIQQNGFAYYKTKNHCNNKRVENIVDTDSSWKLKSKKKSFHIGSYILGHLNYVFCIKTTPCY